MEVRAHAFHSPYRCLECGDRFWVLSRKTRLAATAGIAAVLGLVALFIVPLWNARHALPAFDSVAMPRASISTSDDTDDARSAAALQAELTRTESEMRRLGDLSASAGRQTN